MSHHPNFLYSVIPSHAIYAVSGELSTEFGTCSTSVRIPLTGPRIAGIRPEGHAEFRTNGAQLQLDVEAEKVNLAIGTLLTVNVNGKAVSMIKLNLGRGELELNTKNGAAVPAVQKGDIVTVVAQPSQATILSGTF